MNRKPLVVLSAYCIFPELVNQCKYCLEKKQSLFKLLITKLSYVVYCYLASVTTLEMEMSVRWLVGSPPPCRLKDVNSYCIGLQ